MEDEVKTICDDCVHREVCGDEGAFEPALQYCVNRLTEDVVGFIGRRSGLSLVTVLPFIKGKYYTLLVPDKKVNALEVKTNPADYKIIGIQLIEGGPKEITITVEKI